MTWFYNENQNLIKEILCRKCIDNEKVSFYGNKDMYTADETVKMFEEILNNSFKNGNISEKTYLEIKEKAIEFFKPTLEKDNIKIK